MNSNSLKYLVCMVLIIQSCASETGKEDKSILPLQEPYAYFDELNKNEFHFMDLDHQLNKARGNNSAEDVAKYTKEFEVAQAECIKKMESRFPEGSVKIPFEQVTGKDTLIVKSAYISGFSFPWNTASSICYYFTVEYDILKKDLWYIPIMLEFIDNEDDILYVCTLSANTSGKTKFQVRAQSTFRNFKKLIINQ